MKSPRKPNRNLFKIRYDNVNHKYEISAEGVIAVIGSLVVLAGVIVFHKYL